MNKYFSQLADNLYQKCTSKNTCSLLFDKEELDGKEYTHDDFFSYTRLFFNCPEIFYRASQKEDYCFTPEKVYSTGQYSFYTFSSPFSTPFEENNRGYFRLITRPGATTLFIFSPGWARRNLHMETALCSKIADAGIDCLLPTKPFHQERTPNGFYSGELFISANQLFTVANFRQYVAELRNIVRYFRNRYQKIGLTGMSSGGLQAGLLTTVEPVDFYFPFMTGAALGNIAWNGNFTKYVKHDLENKQVTEAALSKIWAIADQLYVGHNCKAKYIKQYISKYDEVIPVTNQLLLHQIYKKPPALYINSAHSSVYFSLHKIIDDMIREIHLLD